MKTPEDEAFDEIARKQGAWGGGFTAKRKMAADKLQEPPSEWAGIKAILDEYGLQSVDFVADFKAALAQPAQEPEMLTIAYQSGYYDGKKAALAGREWNFCERCGKRTADKTVIHTCTPPQKD